MALSVERKLARIKILILAGSMIDAIEEGESILGQDGEIDELQYKESKALAKKLYAQAKKLQMTI